MQDQQPPDLAEAVQVAQNPPPKTTNKMKRCLSFLIEAVKSLPYFENQNAAMKSKVARLEKELHQALERADEDQKNYAAARSKLVKQVNDLQQQKQEWNHAAEVEVRSRVAKAQNRAETAHNKHKAVVLEYQKAVMAKHLKKVDSEWWNELDSLVRANPGKIYEVHFFAEAQMLRLKPQAQA